MILGIHCSVRKGFGPALEEALSHACEAMQILPYPRHHDPTPEECAEFKRAREASPVRRLIAHVRYVPFLASADEKRHAHSRDLLVREFALSKRLGAESLIIHVGAYSPGDEPAKALARFADGCAKAWAEAGGEIELVVENVPGGARRMGGTLEELAELGALLERRKVPTGFCLDTAHAWAQGYDLSSAEAMWRFVGQANRLLGAERIKVFHLNDSRALLGSHREHHWHWGQGYLGTEPLEFLLNRPEFAAAVGILETPKDLDKENVALARSLLKS